MKLKIIVKKAWEFFVGKKIKKQENFRLIPPAYYPPQESFKLDFSTATTINLSSSFLENSTPEAELFSSTGVNVFESEPLFDHPVSKFEALPHSLLEDIIIKNEEYKEKIRKTLLSQDDLKKEFLKQNPTEKKKENTQKRKMMKK
jgi:hypothetical protein